MGIYGCSGLAFDNSGTLFALGQPTDEGAEYLFTVDTASGHATEVGQIAATSHPYHDVNIAFSSDGTLYADYEGNGVNYLYTLNPATGSPTLVGTIENDQYGVGDMMTFGPDGTLYYSNANDNQGEWGNIPIWSLNPANGTPTPMLFVNGNVTTACKTSHTSYPSLNAGAFDHAGNFYVSLNCYGTNYLGIIENNAINNIGQTIRTLNGLAFGPFKPPAPYQYSAPPSPNSGSSGGPLDVQKILIVFGLVALVLGGYVATHRHRR
jgi:hypothetical protein